MSRIIKRMVAMFLVGALCFKLASVESFATAINGVAINALTPEVRHITDPEAI